MDAFQYNIIAQRQELEDDRKIEDFLLRIKPFEDIESLEEAKEIAKSILPTAQEYTTFFVGNAKCSVVNKSEMFRVCVDALGKFTCYDFS